MTTDRVLGVDPGTRVCGFGVVDLVKGDMVLVDAGAIEAKESDPIEKRLALVFAGIEAALSRHAPRLVVVEEAFYGKNVRSAIRLGEGRGCALLAAARAGVAVVELQASLVKKAVTGHGAATKEQVRAALEATLRGKIDASLPLDATDALALAVAAHARKGAPGGVRRRRGGGSRWTAEDLARLGLRGEE
jgi:crossover junction endodeoxyribonuclease RuvC